MNLFALTGFRHTVSKLARLSSYAESLVEDADQTDRLLEEPVNIKQLWVRFSAANKPGW